MSKKVKIELDRAAIGTLLKSAEVTAVLTQEAAKISVRAPHSKVGLPKSLGTRMRVGVEQEQTQTDREEETLRRAVHFQ